jgi:hypothetical protein
MQFIITSVSLGMYIYYLDSILNRVAGLPHENSLAAHFVILGLENACFS